MSQQEILIVDDDRSLLEIVKAELGRERFVVWTAASVTAAIERLRRLPRPDAMILDISLEPEPAPPGRPRKGASQAMPGDGLGLLRWLRRDAANLPPVIMLSGTDAENVKVMALDLGADDYVTKPFGVRELAARVRAVLRRIAPAAEETLSFRTLHGATLEIDAPRHMVRIDGESTDLTHAELGILTSLAHARGRVLTRAQLLDAVFGSGRWAAERTIDVHVRRLRQKVEPDPGTPEIVLTVRGAGYRFGL